MERQRNPTKAGCRDVRVVVGIVVGFRSCVAAPNLRLRIILFRTIDKVLYGVVVGWVERQRNPTEAGC